MGFMEFVVDISQRRRNPDTRDISDAIIKNLKNLLLLLIYSLRLGITLNI
jgi:hypothetical protein